MFARLFSSSPIHRYRQYRVILLKLNHKIIDAYVDNAILETAARKLNLGRNRQLYLDNEDELSVLMDFALHEIKWIGQNLVRRYQEEKGGQGKIETDLLEAMTKSRSGLFRIQQVWPRKSQMKLRELTGACHSLILTDVNLSRTSIDDTLLFLRVFELKDFAMTSGVIFVFRPQIEKKLMQRWEQGVPSERYAGFFRLSKRLGIKTQYK
jgi:hypothetical protein